MATPREQHGSRARAHVVGSAHLDGRQPVVEAPLAAGDPAEPAPNAGNAGQEARNAEDAAVPPEPDDLPESSGER